MIKNILNKVSFHYTYLIMAFGLTITGHFINLIVFTSLIIIHELGHIIASKFYHYQIKEIIIYPYGGLTKIDKQINTNINNDLVVAISGVLFQSIYSFLILFLFKEGIVREYVYNIFISYHKSMLVFNILPIIPLDGSKIFNLIISKYISYCKANILTIIISFITIIIFLFSGIFDKNYSIILIIGILLDNIYKYYQELSYLFDRFLLERYLYNYNYKKYKVINNVKKMYKNKKHYFRINDSLMKEKEYLTKKMKNSHNLFD